MSYVRGHRQQPPDPPPMGTAVTPAQTSPASWDAFADVDAFVDAVLAELAAMAADGTRPTRSGPKAPLTGAALRKRSWRFGASAFAACSGAPLASCATFRSARSIHPVRPRLGLWRRLLNRLILAWRQACGDTADPSAVILDSPLSLSASGQLPGESSCQSAPTCFTRGFDGGKKIKGSIVEAPRSMIHLAVDKYGFPLAISVSPANRHGPWQRRQAVQQGYRPGVASACRLQGDSAGRSQLSGSATVQGWRGAWHHPSTQRRRSRRILHSGGDSGRALPGLDQPLPPVEYHL